MKSKTIYKWVLPVICVIGLSSCLKNKNEQPDFTSVTPVVELPVNSPVGDGSVNGLSVAFLVDTLAATDYFIYVNYAAPEANATDLKITLAVDPAALARYNAVESNDSLTVLPAGAFTMPLTVTIPAGQRKVQIPMKITTKVLDATTAYGLPITVTDASGVVISKNFASLVVKIALKNKYDGVYDFKGFVLREGDPVLSGNFTGKTTELVTDGVNSNTFAQVWSTGGGVGGIDGLTLTVDEATNKVTMRSKANGALKNAAGYDNHYDPATRTFYLSFYWGTGPTNRAATDTLTYKGVRN